MGRPVGVTTGSGARAASILGWSYLITAFGGLEGPER